VYILKRVTPKESKLVEVEVAHVEADPGRAASSDEANDEDTDSS
jgi:hypothetical protein